MNQTPLLSISFVWENRRQITEWKKRQITHTILISPPKGLTEYKCVEIRLQSLRTVWRDLPLSSKSPKHPMCSRYVFYFPIIGQVYKHKQVSATNPSEGHSKPLWKWRGSVMGNHGCYDGHCYCSASELYINSDKNTQYFNCKRIQVSQKENQNGHNWIVCACNYPNW